MLAMEADAWSRIQENSEERQGSQQESGVGHMEDRSHYSLDPRSKLLDQAEEATLCPQSCWQSQGPAWTQVLSSGFFSLNSGYAGHS